MFAPRGTRLGSALALAALVAASPVVAAAKDKASKRGDVIWVHPDSLRFALESIAILPASTYDHVREDERLIEVVIREMVKPKGYRLISPLVSKDLLMVAFRGDSVLKALHDDILENVRVDSLSAPRLCAALRVKALLTARADQMEKLEMRWDQAGKPTTTVKLKAALVDSLGRLLWTGSGSETAEGPYHDPSSGTVGVEGSGLENKPITGQGGAPAYEDVLSRLVARWSEYFPAKVTPPPPGP